LHTRAREGSSAVIGWDRYAGPSGAIIGMHSFGVSARDPDLMRKFAFVPDKITQAAKTRIARNSRQ